jgi:hypothetical protein
MSDCHTYCQTSSFSSIIHTKFHAIQLPTTVRNTALPKQIQSVLTVCYQHEHTNVQVPFAWICSYAKAHL